MTEILLQHIERIFYDAVERTPAERESFLRNSCSDNPALYDEVFSLLSAWEGSHEFLQQNVFDFGMQVLADEPGQLSLAGKTVGPFIIKSVLGRGGSGVVYLAVDSRLDRQVALKFISSELGSDNAKDQLIREAKAAAQLDHPNICQIYSIEYHAEATFIVMQYIDGITLSQLLRKGPINRVLLNSLIKQVVSALAHAHTHGVVHRDIKPQNIMITRDGKAKILDFGLAISLRKKESTVEASDVDGLKAGMVAGTLKYMSPEQLRGLSLDYRTDVFSLGTLLYEMVSGTNPFTRKRSAATIKAIQSVEPKPLRKDLRPRQIRSIVQRCLAKDPTDRYGSADGVWKDLVRRETRPLALSPKRNHGLAM